ncbi:hypothetical protein FJT64_003787 [Amphibalanus amphitrite]|uniref:Uncharacterized protein n=1 Tax=Amphibalanus amphitrite TaxID=1232801 RepID=A0A6A4VRP3_AMPAM|nr:hypothetical protein FJT64_003787 [Amphibalanus amphitrite]
MAVAPRLFFGGQSSYGSYGGGYAIPAVASAPAPCPSTKDEHAIFNFLGFIVLTSQLVINAAGCGGSVAVPAVRAAAGYIGDHPP